jgi:hypothetical protein
MPDCIYLTTEQIASLHDLAQQGVLIGVEVRGDDHARSTVSVVAVRNRNGVLDNDISIIEADGATPGWER